MEYNETKYRKQRLQWVAKVAATLNTQLVPITRVVVTFLDSVALMPSALV